ncbi:hypothetical protein FAF38_09600 [Staphylococcus aureus]|nr:hypothetical protein C7R08_13675 [Staphylococcus aureus]TJX49641.1 hypothetical protein FAF22_09885 [Staphylococcus aureus]TJX56702.1 hypothetical protein FAF16_10920 [Staphylococcus aureus]TJX78125.1 hypothetical protein FAF38_09600 [Staphylococcus aureus]TJX94796.1 hypothetical protein FAF37_13585 [Staphylococcus aureus]
MVIKRLETVYLYNFRYLDYIMNNILVQAPRLLNKHKNVSVLLPLTKLKFGKRFLLCQLNFTT